MTNSELLSIITAINKLVEGSAMFNQWEMSKLNVNDTVRHSKTPTIEAIESIKTNECITHRFGTNVKMFDIHTTVTVYKKTGVNEWITESVNKSII